MPMLRVLASALALTIAFIGTPAHSNRVLGKGGKEVKRNKAVLQEGWKNKKDILQEIGRSRVRYRRDGRTRRICYKRDGKK